MLNTIDPGKTSMLNADEHFKSFIEVSFGPNWDNIAITRRYIDEMVHTEIGAFKAKLLSAAASELMENACKYSCYGGGFIALSILHNTENLKIQVMNITTTENIMELENRIACISQGDPEVAYRNAMLESYEKKSGKSQLGLAKIRYECNAQITLKVLNEIPDLLISADKRAELLDKFGNARAIEVSIVSTLN